MAPKNKRPTIITTEVVAQSRLFTVEQLHLKFSNGVERQYERMKGSGRGAVMVVPMLDPKTLLLIREYACGTHSYEMGFPKGLIDPGETPMEAANRELKEEIGYGARQFIELKSLAMAPGYFGAKMHILLARDLYEESLLGDEPEPLEVVPWSVDDLPALMAQEDFNDARSVAALLMTMQAL